jgi:hypothetical protein
MYSQIAIQLARWVCTNKKWHTMGVAAADVKSIAGKDHFKSRIPQQSFLLYVTHYN